MNILLAEDNQDDVLIFTQALKKADVPAKLWIVSDGEETLAYLKGEGEFRDRELYPLPDVLLLDLNMPRMNGFEVLEWIRQDQLNKCLIVYVLTASVRPVDVRRVYELHANSYIVKPSRLNDLIALINGIFEWHRFVQLPKRELLNR